MNWIAPRERVRGGLCFTLSCDNRDVTFGDVLLALRDEGAFRVWFNAVLAEVPFPAFRWETPGLTAATAMRGFEFVALDEPVWHANPIPTRSPNTF